MKRYLSILAISITLILCLAFPADATFTTGTGKHTFKIESFRVTPQIQLQAFLIGFGIDNQSAFNIKLTQATDTADDEKPEMNFIIPSYEGINDPKYEFSLRGPIVDFNYQYIPKHPFFVTSNSLNALQVGLKNYTGKVYDISVEDNPVIQTVDKTYLNFGLLSRSRWDNYNLFSDFKFAYDIQEIGGWLFNSQIGLEYKLRENIRLQGSYRAIASSADSQQGSSLGVRIHY
ncbi:MAG: hypothetical protein ACQEP9_00640 [Bacillota bacterium]